MQKLIDFGADIHIHSLYGGPIHAAVALDDEIALEALMRKSVNVIHVFCYDVFSHNMNLVFSHNVSLLIGG